MSDSVVIKKTTQEAICQILDRFGWKEESDALRAAPETVSLEGVHQYALFDFGPVVRVSDLPHLVPPVQPSAVVSRETIDAVYAKVTASGKYNPNDLIDAIYSLQLPQPVAPVQSGGVELDNILNEWGRDLEENTEWDIGTTDPICVGEEDGLTINVPSHLGVLKDTILAHLTTTQSAPNQTVCTTCGKGHDDDQFTCCSNGFHLFSKQNAPSVESVEWK